MKKTVTKILSLICLVAVLVCGFVPFANITGQYKEMLAGITSMFTSMPEEQIVGLEQMLDQVGIKLRFRPAIEAIEKVVEPINDGGISIVDFYEMSKAAKAVHKVLDGVTTAGMQLEQYEMLEQVGIVEMVDMLGNFDLICEIASIFLLVPVGLFAFLAFVVIMRIILRLLNSRGLGVIITLIAILNAALMMALPIGLNFVASEGLPIDGEVTYVPILMVVCCIANCVIWAIGRGPKVKAVVEEPLTEESAPVEETVPAEEVVAE